MWRCCIFLLAWLVLHVCSWNSLVHCIFGPIPLCSDTSLVHCIFCPMHCNAKFWRPNYKGILNQTTNGFPGTVSIKSNNFPPITLLHRNDYFGMENLFMPRQKCKCAPISAMGIRRSSSVVYRLSALAPSISSGESHWRLWIAITEEIYASLHTSLSQAQISETISKATCSLLKDKWSRMKSG